MRLQPGSLRIMYVEREGGTEMARVPAAGSLKIKVRAHRRRLREQGLRPIQLWVPDVRSPEFLAEAKRQCLLIANSAQEKEDQAFVDSVSILWDENFKD